MTDDDDRVASSPTDAGDTTEPSPTADDARRSAEPDAGQPESPEEWWRSPGTPEPGTVQVPATGPMPPPREETGFAWPGAPGAVGPPPPTATHGASQPPMVYGPLAAGPAGPSAEPGGGHRRRRRRGVSRVVVVLLVLLALVIGFVAGLLASPRLEPAPQTLPAAQDDVTNVPRPPDSVAGIASQALESTVFIRTASGEELSSGSGMVLRADGYLVTNNHVVAGAAGGDGEVQVVFSDGTEEAAEIVGRTSAYDVAVLKVDRTGLVPLALADSDEVVVGDPVVAAGAPLGLDGTVTSGIVSALNRPVEAGGEQGSSFINAIQTDAAINPGNSGGPLLNTAGEVIGINTAIAQGAGRATGNIGLGFAIPANQVRRTAEQLIATGEATYPVIGVALDTTYGGEGVRVLTAAAGDTDPVTRGGPGDDAGIRPGDIILTFDGQPMTSAQELVVAVRSRAPGDEVVLDVRRDDAEQEYRLVLGETAAD